jgi:Fe-Mn family superoxide dismutase
MSPQGGGEPNGDVAAAIEAKYGSFEKFKTEFNGAATSNFGSGWTWLVQNAAGELEIVNTDDAETPLIDPELTPLMTVDVWEHAYYVDYRNDRGAYLKSFWNLANWDFVATNLNQGH